MCETWRRSVKFLGHQVGETGLELCADLISKITDAPKPLDKKQLRSFLGLVGYYRKFAPNFATVAAPLTELTQKTYPNMLTEVWGEAQDRTFLFLETVRGGSTGTRVPRIVRSNSSCRLMRLT